MDEARWQLIQKIFTLAMDDEESARASIVRENCAGDRSLEIEVMELLEADASSQPLLDSSMTQAASWLLESDAPPLRVQEQLGRYRILKLLGEGGMGIVYLAERTDIGGLVAIKLLRDAWLSPMRRQRFHIEQLALAQLNHPSIARIYDSGTLEDGTPWFVMEYAEGQPLTEYAIHASCSLREALLLMRSVCEAVQYAHSYAIIHRDLKPSNILVEASGKIKLLDFGIAKQLSSDEERQSHAMTDPTITGLRLMTLAYAAPEQLSGAAVGVYTDVYALGVLLYELIAGQLPPRAQNPDFSSDAFDAEIERPSATLRRNKKLPRGKLSHAECQDVDVLILKAMERVPERRYGTVQALMRDIDAFLEGRPLEARPPEWRYTAAKFIRRNRRTLITLTAFLLIITAMIAVYTVRLARARNTALHEAARTLRIQQFTESLFDGGDKAAGPAMELRAVELLDRGRRQAEGLNQDPQMQADLKETLGSIYLKLGKLDLAEPLLVSALAARRKDATEQSKIADSLVALGMLRREQGRLDEAEAMMRQALEIAQQQPASSAPALARAWNGLGAVLETRGKYGEALTVLESARRLRPAGADATTNTADNLFELASVHFYQGDYGASEALNKQALEIYRKFYGEEHPVVAGVLNNLGAIETNRGNYSASEAYYRRALTITESWYGVNHPETAANLTAIAQQLSYQKKDAEAQKLLEQALEIQKRGSGGMSATVATTLNQLGVLAYDRDQYDVARAYFTQAMEMWRKSFGDQHQFLAVAYSNMGSVCMDQKDYACAERNFREAIQRFDSVSKDNLNAAIAHLKLGRVLLRESRYSNALPETSLAYEYLVKHVPATNGFLSASRKDLAAIYEGLHNKERAVQIRDEIAAVAAQK
jgi:serine/threonine-protein kinase